MKQLIQVMLIMGIVFTSGLIQAQPGGEPSPLVGDWRSQSALVLSDALMLNQEKTDKIVEIYRIIGEKRRQEMQDSGNDFQSMSDEERREWFTNYRKKVAADMAKDVKNILSDNELKEVEALMMIRTFSPVPELRGLRLIELKDEQRKKIQPMSIALSKKIVPGRFGFFGSQPDDTDREAAEKAFQEEKSKLIASVKEMLSEEQNIAWQEKIDAINKELEEIRERMRNFQR
jgi:hypothetical protein